MATSRGFSKTTTILFYAALLLLGGFLLFSHLDNRLLWGDEAETAVLAKNVTIYGIPRTVDGVNHITLYGRFIDENTDHIWTWSPWLQEYLTAFSFNFFGTTTWSARAPFAFVGMLSLILFTFVVHRIYQSHLITSASLLLLTTSEIFLLHCRQCRYYSVSVFGEILLIYAAYQLICQNKKGAYLLSLALILQFYSNYLIALANVPALGILSWMVWKENRRAFWWIIGALAGFGIIALPWVLYAKLWRQLCAIQDPFTTGQKVLYYFSAFHFFFLPLVIFLMPACRFIASRIARKQTVIESSPASTPTAAQSRWELFAIALLPLYLIILLIPPGAYTRYLLPVLPIVCVLTTVWIFRYVKWRPLAIGLILILCLTNGISVITGPWEKHEFRSPIVDFIKGWHPYQERSADVIHFLRKESQPGETVFVLDPEFPLIFYTALQIIDGRLQGNSLPSELPDWILSESASGVTYQNPIKPEPNLEVSYEKIILPIHNSYRRGSVPLPETFQYQTPTNLIPFIIYKRIKNGQ